MSAKTDINCSYVAGYGQISSEIGFNSTMDVYANF